MSPLDTARAECAGAEAAYLMAPYGSAEMARAWDACRAAIHRVQTLVRAEAGHVTRPGAVQVLPNSLPPRGSR